MHDHRVRHHILDGHRPSRPPPHRRMTLGLSLAAALTLAAAPAIRAQNIRTVVTPEATAVRWDNNLGLENKALYGGRVDLEFDRWISLEGYFHTNNGVQTAA